MFPVEERFTIALHAGARAWRAALERHLKANGVTAAGWSALAVLAAAMAPPSQRELARRLGVDGATLVSTIDRLVAGGLVERLPGPHDRRVKLVALTDAGRDLAGRVEREAALLRLAIAERIDRERLESAAAVLEELQRILEHA